MTRYEVRWISTNGQWQIRQETPLGGLSIINTRTDDGWGVMFRDGSALLDQLGGKRIPAYVMTAAHAVWSMCR